MTQLQKLELSMLKVTIDIIESLGLRYYLVCGTALGAVKYGGFIPWDDDVDIALPREDYEKFCEKAVELLPENLFLQNYKTDPQFPMIFSKIRNSDTTYIEKSMASRKIHHGVYIDVFPLDGYPNDPAEREKLEKIKYKYTLSSLCCFDVHTSEKVRLFAKVQRLFGMHKRMNKRTEKFEKIISSYSLSESELWCNHGNWQGAREYAPKSQYGDGYKTVFEGIEVTVPEKFHEYLTQKYGDWRADLPKEEQVGHHFYKVCDLEKSYTEYI